MIDNYDDLSDSITSIIRDDDNDSLSSDYSDDSECSNNIKLKLNPHIIFNSCKPSSYLINSNNNSLPWIEQYRPSSFDNFLSQTIVINTLLSFIKLNYFPNMIFFGSSGTGKTSLAVICSKQSFISNHDLNVLIINASAERGIDIIRNKVKSFAISECNDNHKFIILDEADSMTIDAQNLLCDIMDSYILNVRFCIISNNLYKLIPKLRSRCFLFYFDKLSTYNVKLKIDNICNQHSIANINSDVYNVINHIYNGDLRKIINAIQSINFIFNSIDINSIYSFSSFPSPTLISTILDILTNNTLSFIIKYNKLHQLFYFTNNINIILELFNNINYTKISSIPQFISKYNSLYISINSDFQSFSEFHLYSLISIFNLFIL